MSSEAQGPSFLILGAQKSGTTWLARMLARQPGVFVPACKELHYFSRRFDKGPDWYAARFAPGVAAGAVAMGEATPNYLAVSYPEYRDVARRIAAYGRDLRFIVILRNPVERAISAYLHHVARGRFNPLAGPEEHFGALIRGTGPGYGLLEFGLYGAQLTEYLDRFDRERFRLYIYEELRRQDPKAVLCDALEFLGLHGREPVGPFDERANVSLRSRGAARLASLISVWMRTDALRFRYGGATRAVARLADVVGRGPRLALAADTRRVLADYYREDAGILQGLLGRREAIWPELQT